MADCPRRQRQVDGHAEGLADPWAGGASDSCFAPALGRIFDNCTVVSISLFRARSLPDPFTGSRCGAGMAQQTDPARGWSRLGSGRAGSATNSSTSLEPQLPNERGCRDLSGIDPAPYRPNHSFSFDHRRRPETFRTAMATARRLPTRTTSRRPRVMPV